MGLMRIFDIILKLHKSQKMDYQSIQKTQKARFLQMITYARNKSPFYRELYKSIKTTDNFEHIPIVCKKALMDNFNEVVTVKDVTKKKILNYINAPKNAYRKFVDKYTVIHSSGTSGLLWISVIDDFCVDYEVASIIARKIVNFSLPPPRLSLISTENMHVGSTRFYKACPWFCANIQFIPINDPISEIVKKINTFDPNFLGSYPNMLKVLSEEKIKGTLKVNPQKIYSAGFQLTVNIKESIIRAFDRIPFIIYSATEITGPIACECKHHSLHVFTDSLIFEVLDENNKHVKPGIPGSVVITNLINSVQPVIRYRLGDVVQMSPVDCPCGSPFPVIEKIWGRDGDIISVKKNDGKKEFIDPILFNLKIPEINKYQIVQQRNDLLTVKLIVCDNVDRVILQVKNRMYAVLKQKNLDAIVNIKVEQVDDIALVNGKHKMVISKLKHDTVYAD